MSCSRPIIAGLPRAIDARAAQQNASPVGYDVPVRILFCLLALTAFLAARTPNIVLIISDDQGWTDYGFMGHPHIRTPNLDRLAAESVVFTRGYVPSSLCRPSLASIMTGVYPHQHRITGNDPPGDARSASNRARMVEVFKRSTTLAALLGRAGYISHQSGKWWEGECQCGGFTEGMTHGDVARGGRHGDEGLKIGRESMQPVFEFIDRAGDKPFFLWYAPFLPHAPHNAPERLLKKYRVEGRPIELARYYAMCEWLDETVGYLITHLDDRKLAQDTLVIFLADNGWVQLQGNRPLIDTRAKMSPYDAGIRTPILLRWPGHIKPQRDEKVLASSVDLAPTALAACNLKPEQSMAGVNLLDRAALTKRTSIFGSLFVHTSIDIDNPVANLKYRWMIRDRWKLIVPYPPNVSLPLWEGQPGTGWSTDVELFDILSDPQEKSNLSRSRADLVRSLRDEINLWWPVPGN